MKKCPICGVIINDYEEMCFFCEQEKKKQKHNFVYVAYEPQTEIEILFLEYLKNNFYKLFTPSDLQSTAYQYVKSVNFVRENEKLDWPQFIVNLDKIINDYDNGGKKQYLGDKSHKTVINALKRFREFFMFSNIKKYR
jgi:hypothetical protein